MDKEDLIASLRRAIPVDVRWERLGKRDLEKLVRLVENPRDAAVLFAARGAQNRAKEFVDRFFDNLMQETKKED